MPAITSPAPNPQDTIPLEPILVDVAASSPHTHTIRRGYTHILFTHVWNGLAVFAILVILRHATVRFLSWKRRKAPHQVNWEDRIDPRIGPVFQRPGSLAPGQQQLHYRFAPLGAPPFRMMDEKSRGVSSTSFSATLDDAALRETTAGPVVGRTVSFSNDQLEEGRPLGDEKMSLGKKSPSHLALQKRLISRPPPPPPLTPPELSTAVFTFDTRRPFHNASGLDLDDSFIHQPNPDYMSSSGSATATPAPATSPRRRSYTKTLPIGIPTPQQSNLSGMSIGSNFNLGSDADLVFSPSSYPPSSPQLPPAPPGHEPEPSREGSTEIEIQGEVISMTDGHGAGWKRHTRVYGGGVCLACAASGGEGGFYGDTVSEEEKR